MSYAIVSNRLQEVEGRTIVDQPAILSSHEQALSNVKVGAGAIDKRCASLRVRAGRVSGIERSTHTRFGKRCKVL